MNFKKSFLALTALISTFAASADEGMWLPSLIGEARIKDMQKKGLKLSADDIYSINQASLKDAVVKLQGCTGEMISGEGLFVTNHHCGYGQIQKHSSVEHDYLTNGFQAASRVEELPNPGYTAAFLLEMKDVTAEVNKDIKASMSKKKAADVRKANIEKIKAKASDGGRYDVSIEPLYYANQYFMFVYETYRDVRLVSAPPSAIGKFGGDTDNWMWPRHTGDFSIFRIYANKDNRPADFSKENVPYKPKRFFPISTKGVKEGDFTFIYGYPGRTSEYIVSDAVKYIAERSNPAKIALRTLRLDIMNKYQAADAAVRIKYASKNASVANAWKKWQGEAGGINRLKVVESKKALEQQFSEWATSNSEFVSVLPELKSLYAELEPINYTYDYYSEALNPIEITSLASRFITAINKGLDEKAISGLKESYNSFLKDYYLPIDKETAVALFNAYIKAVPAEYIPSELKDNSVENVVDRLYSESLFVDSVKVRDMLSQPADKIKAIVEADYATKLRNNFSEMYKSKIESRYKTLNDSITAAYNVYMRGLMAMQGSKEFYPDANLTLRVAYGKVGGFKPADGVTYLHQTTLDGIMEKDNPDIYDYNVPQKLRDIYVKKDFGRWDIEGTVPVAFIASNHTTGGNSGSPIINGDGELVGVNFDRCWESTMSDIVYDEEFCRNIAVDIRYVLFVLDKVSNGSWLLNEMELR